MPLSALPRDDKCVLTSIVVGSHPAESWRTHGPSQKEKWGALGSTWYSFVSSSSWPQNFLQRKSSLPKEVEFDLEHRDVIPSTGGHSLILPDAALILRGKLPLAHNLQLFTISCQFHMASRSGIGCFLLTSWIASMRYKGAQIWTSVYWRHHCGPGGLFSLLMPFREGCEPLLLLTVAGSHPEGN